jgi:DNA polymerase-3 subunit gamma/tau
MYTVLARRYRSQTFDDVVGQDAIAQTLKNAIKTGRVAHAYLFTGTRGVGKTTMARILAKSLNCLSADGPTVTPCLKCDSCINVNTGEDVDVIEIDGASNRGIEHIRELRQNAIYRPARSRFKIYIIDEVHMLTSESFNALLKILEEPPGHVKFIFATTEPNKVLPTIQSRCQRFDFVNISAGKIAEQLGSVLKQEGIKFEEDVTIALARMADGSMRDALSLLDQVLSTGIEPLTVAVVEEYLGQPNRGKIAELVGKIGQADAAGALELIDELLTTGQSAAQLLVALIDFMRDVMVVKSAGEKTKLVVLTAQQRQQTAALADSFDIAALIYNITALERLRYTIRNSDTPRALLEAALLRLTLSEHFMNIGDLLESGGQAVKKKITDSPAVAPQLSRPPVNAPSAQPAGPHKTYSGIEEIKADWANIISSVAQVGGNSIAGLLGSAVPAAMNGEVLCLQFPHAQNFIRQMCESSPKNEQIAAALGQVLSRTIRLKCETGSDVPIGKSKPPGAKASKEEREKVVNDPAIRTLLTGLNATVTGIDEAQ